MEYIQYVQPQSPFGEAHNKQSQIHSSPLHNLGSVTIYGTGNRLCFITRHTSESVNLHHIFHNNSNYHDKKCLWVGKTKCQVQKQDSWLVLACGGDSEANPWGVRWRSPVSSVSLSVMSQCVWLARLLERSVSQNKVSEFVLVSLLGAEHILPPPFPSDKALLWAPSKSLGSFWKSFFYCPSPKPSPNCAYSPSDLDVLTTNTGWAYRLCEWMGIEVRPEPN